MTRWHTLILLAMAITLGAFECNEHLPGEPIARTPETEAWHAAIDDVAEDWASEPSLPSLDRRRCDEALAEVELRMASEDEWIGHLRICPRMPDGCSTRCGRVVECNTGTVAELRNRWRVILSPGEDASGHELTVRHEVAHILSACTGRGIDALHTSDLIWRGPGSVVWRDYGQSNARVACGLGGS
jgi:hypothetical protein